MSARMLRCVAAGVVLAVMPAVAMPQAPAPATGLPAEVVPRWQVGATGEGRLVQHRVDAGNGVELSSGTLFGGSLVIAIGRFVEVAGGGSTGSLTADSAQADDATLARGEVHVAILPTRWLAVRVGGEAHSFSTDVAVQRWNSLRLGGEGRLRFVGGRVSGLVRFEFYPMTSVTGQPNPSRGFGAASGLTFAGGAVTASLLYELERWDFPQSGGVERKEQIGYLTMGLGLRFGR